MIAGSDSTGRAPAGRARSAMGRAGSPSILKMAAPLILSFWMRSLFTFVDTIYAKTLGDEAVAAIGLSIPFEFLMIALWVGVSTGLTSNLSRAMGAREGGRIEQLLEAARRIVWCLIPAFFALGVGVYLWAPHSNLPPRLALLFGVYVGVLVSGSALSSFWSIIPDSIVKAHHDTRSTMWAGIWSNMINVGLNTIFLFVFHWGIFGIAFSTVVGRLGGLVYALRKAGQHEASRKASGLDTSPALDPAPYRSMLTLSVPSALTYGLMALESTLVNWLLAKDPDPTASIAAFGIYYRVLLFAMMPILATAVAVLPFVARRFGEDDIASISAGLRQASFAAAGYCLLVVAPSVAFGGPHLARFLAHAADTEAQTRAALLICPLACLASIPFILCRPAFEGLQRGRPGLVMAVLRYVVLTVPCAFAGMSAARRLGKEPLYGLLAGLVGASAIASYVFLIWMRRTLRDLSARRSPSAPLQGERVTAAPPGAADLAAIARRRTGPSGP